LELPLTSHPGGNVLWLTGFSGAGKTTLAKAIQRYLRTCGTECVVIDGDMVRSMCGDDCGYDVGGRKRNAMRVARFAKMIADQGIITVVATISLYHEIHDWNRANQPGYFEVLLEQDIATCRRRDAKRIYRPEAPGTEINVVGVDIPAELPRAPHLRLKNSGDQGDMVGFAEKIIHACRLGGMTGGQH
jgi:adenylylsulfate kinase